jgi:hypothetical protein
MREDPLPGPENGHTFEFYVRERGVSSVVGEGIYRDYGYWMGLRRQRVRALSLADALSQVFLVPLGDWSPVEAPPAVEGLEPIEGIVDDLVDIWHTTGEFATGPELGTFLGMTDEEYTAWATSPSTLPFRLHGWLRWLHAHSSGTGPDPSTSGMSGVYEEQP